MSRREDIGWTASLATDHDQHNAIGSKNPRTINEEAAWDRSASNDDIDVRS